MIKQLISQALNGFSLIDLPFLVLQLSVSAFLVIILRQIWLKKHAPKDEEKGLFKYILPLQIVLTLVAVFSLQAPWIIVLFGFMAIIPFLGNNNVDTKTKIFYMLVVAIAFGCGSANVVVTSIVFLIIIFPLLYLNK